MEQVESNALIQPLLINEYDAARMLGCSVHKLRRDRVLKSGLPFVKTGKSVGYLIRDIQSYINSNKIAVLNSEGEVSRGYEL